MSWYVWLIFIVIYSAIWFGLGVVYRARKIKKAVAILSNSSINAEEKIKQLLALLVG